MEFSANGSLLDLVMSIHANERKINLDMARFWFRRILMGVDFMHSRDFVHLDIKHDNILLDQANEPKLADFGFTKHVTGNISVWCCTKEYAAPEVLRGTTDTLLLSSGLTTLKTRRSRISYPSCLDMTRPSVLL